VRPSSPKTYFIAGLVFIEIALHFRRAQQFVDARRFLEPVVDRKRRWARI